MQRQRDSERASLIDFAARQLPAVQPHDFLGEGQAQPGARLACTRLSALRKNLSKTRGSSSADADARVLDFDDEVAGRPQRAA